MERKKFIVTDAGQNRVLGTKKLGDKGQSRSIC